VQAYISKRCHKHIKKALVSSAFFFVANFLLFLFATPILAANCTSPQLTPPEKATVKWVYDGDSLLLRDKRKIRIIGIDTPEVKHHQQKAQAYGAKAREALRELLKSHDYQVYLRYGAERKDRYSRILAHVYLPDGTNISNWLLERGYAKTLAIPPNIKLAKCYQKDEEKAQQQSLKIWRYKKNQIKTVEKLSQRSSGYIRLEGTIKKIKRHKKSLILEFKGNSKKRIRVKIQKKNLKYFKALKFDKLLNKTILVTGTLRKRYGKRTIYVNYPTQLKVLSNRRETKSTRASNATLKWSIKK